MEELVNAGEGGVSSSTCPASAPTLPLGSISKDVFPICKEQKFSPPLKFCGLESGEKNELTAKILKFRST